MSNEWGPLARLAGDWEGDGGLDVAFSHSRNEVYETSYREKVTFKPFGPVDNGRQSLYGLDYKTAMWRDSEENPFHTEVGYWLWDAATGEVLRGFVVPRGITVLAGGFTTADSNQFTLTAGEDGSPYRIGENQYLVENASTTHYTSTISINSDDSWSYTEVTTLQMKEFPDPFAHTDLNLMHRVG